METNLNDKNKITDSSTSNNTSTAFNGKAGTKRKLDETNIVTATTSQIANNSLEYSNGADGIIGSKINSAEYSLDDEKADKPNDNPPPKTNKDENGTISSQQQTNKKETSTTNVTQTVGDEKKIATKNSKWDESNKPIKKRKKTKTKTKNMDPAILAFRRTIHQCCSTNDLSAALTAYQGAISNNVRVEAQSFYNLLNLCDGLDKCAVHVGTPKPDTSSIASNKKKNDWKGVNVAGCDLKQDSESSKENVTNILEEVEEVEVAEIDLNERKKWAFEIKSRMDSLDIPLNETAYTALIRILSKANDTTTATQILTEAECSPQCKPKLRLYSSLLLSFCQKSNMKEAICIWHRMSKFNIEPSEREYCGFIQCATQVGDNDVMDLVLRNLAEDVLVPSLETTSAIVKWFESSHSISNGNDGMKQSALEMVVLPKNDAPCIGPVQYKQESSQRSTKKWKISYGCEVDTKTGILQSGCLSQTKLQPVSLSDVAWRDMMEMNESIVLKKEENDNLNRSIFAGGGKGKKRGMSQQGLERRMVKWKEFKAFLEKAVGPPFTTLEKKQNYSRDDEDGEIQQPSNDNEKEQQIDINTQKMRKRYDVVIDGANVGYYKQNFANAPKHVDYNQIDSMVHHFLNLNQSVLLVLHERHFASRLMPRWAEQIVRQWEELGVLFRTPFGSNDDWFWMHAALWCGPGTKIVSNDEMRDHHFQMLAHRSFLRWKERHQVRFSFDGWLDGVDGDNSGVRKWNHNRRKVHLEYPDVYSRRIQRMGNCGLVIPLPKRGDINRFLDGSHEANEESTPVKETYVCIKLSDLNL